jgi:hypothetical protein
MRTFQEGNMCKLFATVDADVHGHAVGTPEGEVGELLPAPVQLLGPPECKKVVKNPVVTRCEDKKAGHILHIWFGNLFE